MKTKRVLYVLTALLLLWLTAPVQAFAETAGNPEKPASSDVGRNIYAGDVGELSLSGGYSREKVNYGESLSLLVTASGNCNLDGIKNIFTGEVSGFSVYETKKNTVESVENNQYHI